MEQALQTPNPQLLDYVQQGRAAGMADAEIRQELLNAGWPEVEVNAALGLGLDPGTPSSKTTSRLRSYKALLAGCGVLVVIVGFFILWRSYQAVGFRDVVGEYKNMRYGYVVQMPPGWRLNTSIMLTLNPGSPLFYSYKEADIAAIAMWDSHFETSINALLEERLKSQGNGLPYTKLLTGQIFLVSAEPDAIDIDLALRLVGNNTKIAGTELPLVQNVRTIAFGNGIKATRYLMTNEAHPGRDMEVIFIPYRKLASDRLGDEIKGIVIRTLHDETFSEEIFSQFYESFKYDSTN